MMTVEEMTNEFSNLLNSYPFPEWKDVENVITSRPDLHLFNLIDKLIPSSKYIISAAEHDQIWLSVDLEELAIVMTPELCKEFVACGAMLSDDARD